MISASERPRALVPRDPALDISLWTKGTPVVARDVRSLLRGGAGAQDLDRKFDADEEDIVSDLDVRAARRPGRDVQRVNVDFPVWMVESLDAEATRLGITRQAIIKTWIAERLDRG